MGKSRRLKTKRVAETLLESYPDKFTEDFEENKRLLSEVMTIPSKTIRNMIAGYLTAAMNRKQKS